MQRRNGKAAEADASGKSAEGKLLELLNVEDSAKAHPHRGRLHRKSKPSVRGAAAMQPITREPIHLIYTCADGDFPQKADAIEDKGQLYFQYATETLRSIFSAMAWTAGGTAPNALLHFHVIADKVSRNTGIRVAPSIQYSN